MQYAQLCGHKHPKEPYVMKRSLSRQQRTQQHYVTFAILDITEPNTGRIVQRTNNPRILEAIVSALDIHWPQLMCITPCATVSRSCCTDYPMNMTASVRHLFGVRKNEL